MMSRLPEVRCEPMYYDVPVLLFDETCSEYKKATQRIALACVPVISVSPAYFYEGNHS